MSLEVKGVCQTERSTVPVTLEVVALTHFKLPAFPEEKWMDELPGLSWKGWANRQDATLQVTIKDKET